MYSVVELDEVRKQVFISPHFSYWHADESCIMLMSHVSVMTGTICNDTVTIPP